jgi:hypothetical protein
MAKFLAMSSDPLLVGAWVKINRAKKHLADLDAAIIAFEATEPYFTPVERNPQTGEEVYRFYLHTPIPPEWAAILGDCVHNLRSALDLLANALVVHGGGTPSTYTVFPISSAAHYSASAIASGLQGASPKAVALIKRMKPYKRGANFFWRLHRLDIADKHRLLVPVAARQQTFSVRSDVRSPGTEHYPESQMTTVRALDPRFPLKDGDIVLSYRRPPAEPDFEDKTEFAFGFAIAFGEGQVFDGESVIPTLNQLVDFTERVVKIFERYIFA